MNEAISWAEWVLIPALIGFLVVFLWHYFRDPYIKVQAEVKDIKTYDYYARSEGEDANEGDKEITVGVTLFPSKPVKVSDILFRLSGKYFSAKEFSLTAGRIVSFSTRVIENKESYMLSFHIPKEFAVNSDNARIIAIALNIKRYSKPIPIKFGDNRQ